MTDPRMTDLQAPHLALFERKYVWLMAYYFDGDSVMFKVEDIDGNVRMVHASELDL